MVFIKSINVLSLTTIYAFTLGQTVASKYSTYYLYIYIYNLKEKVISCFISSIIQQ